MNILIFGNEIYAPDALPLRLLPELNKQYPHHNFVHTDPNEDWNLTGDVLAIDTVINIEEPQLFDSIEVFELSPRVSMHDFDALMQLKLMKKLGKISSIKIIGLPPKYDYSKALIFIDSILQNL